MKTLVRICLFATLCATNTTAAWGADWPSWRYDARRSAASPEELPGELHLQWVRQYTPREPVWDDPLNQDLMQYDRVFEPVVMDNGLFLGFNDSDKVVALDLDTGQEQWAFYTDGPVRFPPEAHQGRVLFVCDDGYLYCLDAATGTLAWKFRGGPGGRRILGNGRLISTWPARGAPVVQDGVVYFAAGIWPFMGTFIYALDAQTGQVQWLNDSDAATFQQQPHGGALAFGGVGPQGVFAVSGDRLLVPGGRSVPAVLDRASGDILYYRFNDQGKTGGAFVCADDDVFFNHHRERVTTMYDLATGEARIRNMGKYPVVTPDTYFTSGNTVMAYDAAETKRSPDKWQEALRWELSVDASGDLIKAGNRLYAAGKGRITAIQLPEPGQQPHVAWAKVVTGSVERLIAANGKLVAVTLDGRVMAFGLEQRPVRQELERPAVASTPQEAASEALAILNETSITDGYAVVYGMGDGNLLEALAGMSSLRLIAFDPDSAKVAALRKRFDEIGLYGKTIAVHEGDPATAGTPQYLASLTIINDAPSGATEALIRQTYSSMRPYGGKTWLRNADPAGLAAAVVALDLPGLAVAGDRVIAREGPLEGAASWTHILGDVSQTGKSNDQRVQLPLGLLWFGGNSNLDVLPRHGHGPTEQVIGGRLFIEGIAGLSARDVYTGRVLWKTPLHDLGTYGIYFNETYKDTPTDTRYNQVHIPGANIRGTNFVAAEDAVYVIQGGSCLVLDPATGDVLSTIALPPEDPEARRPQSPPWGYLGVYKDLLLAGADFVAFSDLLPRKKKEYDIWEDFDYSASRALLIMDRKQGDVHWSMDSTHGFLHNGTVAGNTRLYCLDKLPPDVEGQLQRRGLPIPDTYRLVACDIRTGEILWEANDTVFGSFLAYSPEHDILLQSTRPSRDTVRGEDGKRMIAYRGADGTVLWDKEREYRTFPLLHGDRIVTESGVFSLATGAEMDRINPLTGEPMPWQWRRMYGCNYPIASEHILTFRSGAAGYYDIGSGLGTGNFGGFKSGCSASLVVADGVLNAPDYTRTCSCPYQNQASVALVHDPTVEQWTYDEFEVGRRPIRRMGVNFGAPGDRLWDASTLWFEYPVVGESPSPDLPVSVTPKDSNRFLHHSSRFSGALPWVTASGLEGLESMSLELDRDSGTARSYTVRLFFAEPEDLAPGDRVFDVALNGQQALTDFDILREAGAARTSVVKEFPGILVEGDLAIALTPANPASAPPLLCGIEVEAEGW